MTFYSNLKIRSKLALGYAIVVACCCLVGFFGIRGMDKINARLDDVHHNLLPSISTATDLDRHSQQYRRIYLRYMLESAPQQRKELEARLADTERSIKKSLEEFDTFPLQPTERGLLNDVTELLHSFFNASKKVRASILSGVKYETVRAEHLRIRIISDQLESKIKELSQFNDRKVADHFEKSSLYYSQLRSWMYALIICTILLAVAMVVLITRSITSPLGQVLSAVRAQRESGKEKARLAEAIAGGDLSQEVTAPEPLKIDTEHISRDEAGMLLRAIVGMSEVQYSLDHAFARMTGSLRRNHEKEILRDWFKNGLNELNTLLRGDKPIAELTERTLAFLTGYLGAGIGVFYLFDEGEAQLRIAASYAFTPLTAMNERIALGEGVAGQAALERKTICLNAAPPGYLPISSGLGEADPVNIVVLPLLHNDVMVGIIEIGSFKIFSSNDLEFLEQSKEGIAIALSVNNSRQVVNGLLEQTQGHTEELRVQQEELQQTNEELEERATMLEETREQIRAKNRELEGAGRELQRKADELEKVSSYKSEFLANMSHELRTPLNSLMILSSLLKDNREGNLTAKQIEFAATINGAGRDLLNLINDILDLSKIEAGHLEFHYEEMTITEICCRLEELFKPTAEEKGIGFSVRQEESAPETIMADSQRTGQILKNLLSNACKFTRHGAVLLRAYTPDGKESPLNTAAVAFAVTDTGIGIPADKQQLVFNAFQQADGSTSRTYGGTGLGLSISRHLARSMGGEISLTSESGKGSNFTLYLPIKGICEIEQIRETAPLIPVNPISPISRPKSFIPSPAPIPDDREDIESGARRMLIIEDDLGFAGILADMVRRRNFAVLVAVDGESGIALAEQFQPSAIILDVMLPHIDGWGVMRSLKDNPVTRHIPVHFITCLEERQKGMGMGAIGYVTKPVSSEQLDSIFAALENSIEKSMKMLLIVEDDQDQAKAMVALLEERNVTITVADSGVKAIELLSREQFECIVLDLGLADMGAFELLEELKRLDPERRVPVIVHTGRELTHEDEKQLHHYAESIIIKGAKSPERLLNEVTLFLHLVESSLDPGKQQMIRSALDKEAMLEGKKILIVDDDMRNIFSLSSALADKNMTVFEAENGCEALKQLNDTPDIDLVLMDIMMPEMDGYEAMRRIRQDPRFQDLPMIALTAKAMKGDREECLKAGASDYIPKPVDMGKLFSLLRVWLYSTTAVDSAEVRVGPSERPEPPECTEPKTGGSP
ncbi:MAG: response regulator [Desulfuromonadaceae bacterium]|nr:response regulator [Desulfuromonadaceae bacterium]